MILFEKHSLASIFENNWPKLKRKPVGLKEISVKWKLSRNFATEL